MKARTLVCIVSLATAMSACNDQQPDAPPDAAAPVETAAPADQAPAAPADASDSELIPGQVPQDRAGLPDTASPLPFAGVAGLLALGIAVGLRLGRRS